MAWARTSVSLEKGSSALLVKELHLDAFVVGVMAIYRHVANLRQYGKGFLSYFPICARAFLKGKLEM